MAGRRKHFKKKNKLPLDLKQLERELKVNKTEEVKKDPEGNEKKPEEEKRDVLLDEFAETMGRHVCDDMRGHGIREKRATLAFSE